MENDRRTVRRKLLDEALFECRPLFRGRVIDFGGKKEARRGAFDPHSMSVECWHYVNIDPGTSPDFPCDASAVPVSNESYDVAVCCETLEHLADPYGCVREIHRVLRSDGVLIGSIPFIFPVHADPYDFQRFTNEGLRYLLRDYSKVTLRAMGDWRHCFKQIVELGGRRLGRRSPRDLCAKVILAVSSILVFLVSRDTKLDGDSSWTTGYFIVAQK